MRIQGLLEFLTEIGTPRLYFGRIIQDRDKVKEEVITQKTRLLSITSPDTMPSFLAVNLDRNEDCVHILRNDQTSLRLLADYVPSYLISSLLLNIMFNQSNLLETRDRLNMITFSLYYYCFLKSTRDLSDLTHNVCFEIEEMIKVILEKELTRYRSFNTSEAVSSLRQRLASERLVNMGNQSRGVNLRRL